MRYVVVIEKTKRNFSAYVPDLPGCVATGVTRRTVVRRIQEAITLHLVGLREDGVNLVKPETTVEYVEA